MKSNLQTIEFEPDDLVSLFHRAKKKVYQAKREGSSTNQSETLDPIKILAGVPEGQRDTTLFKYACRLREKGLMKEEAQVLVLKAAQGCEPEFPAPDAWAKIESAWKYPSGSDSQKAINGEKGQESGGLYNFKYVTLENIYAKKLKEKPIVNDFLYEDEPTIIYGSGGVGKSLITEDLSMTLGSNIGKLWDTFEIPRYRAAMFVQSENGRLAVHQRTMLKCGGNPDYKKGLQNIVYAGQHGNIQVAGHVTEKEFRTSIVEFTQRTEEAIGLKIEVIFWDPLISFHDGEENDNSRMRTTLDYISEVSNEIGATPVVVHHANKERGGLRGASAIFDWARNIIKLEDETYKGEKRIKFTHEKCNNAKMFDPFVLAMDEHLNFSAIEFSKTIPIKAKERCQKVKESLELLGGCVDKKSLLVAQYKQITGVKSESTIHKHIDEAVKNSFIKMKYYQENKMKQARYWIDIKPSHF